MPRRVRIRSILNEAVLVLGASGWIGRPDPKICRIIQRSPTIELVQYMACGDSEEFRRTQCAVRVTPD